MPGARNQYLESAGTQIPEPAGARTRRTTSQERKPRAQNGAATTRRSKSQGPKTRSKKPRGPEAKNQKPEGGQAGGGEQEPGRKIQNRKPNQQERGPGARGQEPTVAKNRKKKEGRFAKQIQKGCQKNVLEFKNNRTIMENSKIIKKIEN